MSGVFKYCLQMNSIACANERIPRRARKSAFLGIVHFAHFQKLLACRGLLKRKALSCRGIKAEMKGTEAQ